MLVVFALFVVEVLAGVAYPACMTVHALTIPSRTASEKLLKQWSHYWVTFSILHVVATTVNWLPFTCLKLGLLALTAMPKLKNPVRDWVSELFRSFCRTWLLLEESRQGQEGLIDCMILAL